MNILFVSETLPGDMSYGGAQRTKLFYDALARCGNVYCLYCYGPDEVADCRFKRIEWRERKGVLHYFNSIWYRIYRKILPVVPGWGMQYCPFPSRIELERIFPGIRFDVVATRYYRMAGMYHLWKYAPLMVDVDDYPLQVYETMIRPGYGGVHKTFADLLVRLVCRLIERNLSGGWLISPEQCDWVHVNCPLSILPNIPVTPSEGYKRANESVMRLFTVGLLVHPPNIEGISWFLRDVWSVVKRRFPAMEYWIVGKGATPENVAKWETYPGVKVVGYVSDLSSVYADALATVVPILSGGGSCIKTLESLAYSCSCLVTAFGARGIEKEYWNSDKYGLMEFCDAESFVWQICKLIGNRALVVENERRGRYMIDEKFSVSCFNDSVRRLICGASED